MNDNKSLAHTTWNCKYHIVYLHQSTEERFTMVNMADRIMLLTMPMEGRGNNRGRNLSR